MEELLIHHQHQVYMVYLDKQIIVQLKWVYMD